ncbi:MAG TPA: deoxynucleoside kinase [Ignavibacteria bacterium]|nr:deoxynucleoside kinase [Bacteroidota bacterium]HRE10007.1 deoxynucleoside kinase [Ignavibacteria bacterium]HRF66926.1 deoxynucleoside kinase [Ignavibacteria bacterium]HRJ05705.1 deoxynucleoside kinase [Ignavibacteria bacterium]
MKAGKKYFISVAGNIGSGKSSLTRMIAKEFRWIPYFESVQNNPYLSDFYVDMKRWSFQLQVYFLSHRFNAHKKIIASKKSVIQDRSIYEDVEIFARNLYLMGRMEKRDYMNYRALFYEMVSYLKPPDLVVYLKADTKTLVKQIKLRGRDFEKSIEKQYLERLNRSYSRWINSYSLGKVLVIESDNIDFVNNPEHFDMIISRIKKNLR